MTTAVEKQQPLWRQRLLGAGIVTVQERRGRDKEKEREEERKRHQGLILQVE